MVEVRSDLLTHWTEVIRAEFDQAYEFEPVADLDYQGLRIHRPLPKEGWPSRGSREILLRVSWAAVSGYDSAGPERRIAADDRLRRFVEWKLRGFNPEHNAELGAEPPQESWIVESEMFLGRVNPVFD